MTSRKTLFRLKGKEEVSGWRFSANIRRLTCTRH